MKKKITIELQKSPRKWGDSRRFAVDYEPKEENIRHAEGRLLTLRVGFESITLPEDEFIRLYKSVDMAEKAGASYPNDMKSFYGLEDNGTD